MYAARPEEEEDGKTPVCDKRDRAITCVFCRDLHLTPMFSGPLQKDLFKGNILFEKNLPQTSSSFNKIFF